MIDSTWRIVLADQSLCFLELFQQQLSLHPRVSSVEIATSCKMLEKLIAESEYQLVILGEQLTDSSLLGAAQLIKELRPKLGIAAFCVHFQPSIMLQHNLKLINHLISRKESLSGVLLAINRICLGEDYITPHAQHLVRIDEKRQIVPKVESPLSQLSPRQVKVLTLLANGMSVKEVAKELHLSPKSVDSHKYRLMLKLHIKDRVELARFAIREGLIEA